MVALQILVLTVGVRILLGELKLNQEWFSFFYAKNAYVRELNPPGMNGSFEYRFSSSPSQGGETGSTPVGANKKGKQKERHVTGMSFFLFLIHIFEYWFSSRPSQL